MILYSGATGSLGSSMPASARPVKTRLESSSAEMAKELRDVSQGQPYTFIHFSGLVLVDECEKNPEKARALNVDGTAKWFEACAETGCTHFVYVSTAHVYAPSDSKLKPTDPTAPRSAYAKSKLEAEQKLKTLKGPPITVARVFSVLPKTLRPGYLLTSLHERAKRKDTSPLPGLSNVRDFLTSDEICKRLVAFAEKPSSGYRIVNVCSGEGKSVGQLALEVYKQYGLSADMLSEAPGRPGDIKYMVGEPTPL